jgi:NurA-like 5'-3' nuclease
MTIYKTNFIITVLLTTCLQTFGQHLGSTFQNAEKLGISIKQLDSLYPSAVHTDTTLAVFKTEKEQVALQQAYIKLLQDFGKFLSENNFKWEKQTRCFNRVYFNSDGTIDYFLFNFLGKTEDKPAENIEKEFQRLLNVFISEYKFSLTAKTKFAQCSPTTYMPQK